MGCCGDVNGVEAVGDVAKMMRTEYYCLKETSEMRRKTRQISYFSYIIIVDVLKHELCLCNNLSHVKS